MSLPEILRDSNNRRVRESLAKIEEIDWLLSCGSGWYEICRQLGSNPRSLSRLCRRYDRADLCSLFDAASDNPDLHRSPTRRRKQRAA